jgi:hypothetical protein
MFLLRDRHLYFLCMVSTYPYVRHYLAGTGQLCQPLICMWVSRLVSQH